MRKAPKPKNHSATLQKKTRRLRDGDVPRVLDLFSGCGGISLGFHASGFRIVGGVEIDQLAAQSHALNFFPDETDGVYRAHASAHDITTTEPDDLLAKFAMGERVREAVDVMVGGPPCQAFARVGRAKLREVDEHPEAYLKDPRGNLYLRFLHYVRALSPAAILMENVPDAVNYGGHNIAQEMCEVLDDLGYDTGYTLLNSVYYGVPQMRERMFLLAYAKDFETEVRFPSPTRAAELPRGYDGTRAVALKTVNGHATQASLNGERPRYVTVPRPQEGLPGPVTAEEALRDLPTITGHLDGTIGRGARTLDDFIPYPKRPTPSDFGRMMREWPGFESHDGINDHAIRYLPRDFPIFERMKPGDQYPQAHELANRMLEEALERLDKDGKRPREGTKAWEKLKASIVPPYDPSKFPNKWRKMEPDQPARTLMAHIGKDTYSHIHYDDMQARTISVREAARLQSFPDGFVFAGAMNAAFRQIGNAVPPLLAKALAEEMLRQLRGVRVAAEAVH